MRSLLELQEHDEWALSKLQEDSKITYWALRRVLEAEHRVSQPPMEPWDGGWSALSKGRPEVARCRAVPAEACPTKSILELAAYDEWGRDKISERCGSDVQVVASSTGG